MKTIAALALLSLWTCYAAPAHADFGDELFKLSASDAAAEDVFGLSVALSGSRALVSSYGDDDDGTYSGSAYLFDVGTGQELHKLTASDAAAFDEFGISVALNGNRALVGAFQDNSGTGSAYLFDVATGQQLFKLTASDAATDDYFGRSVALSGNRALIGAYTDDDNGGQSGSAYLFDTVTGQQLFKFTASDGAQNDIFGTSVALSGNIALIGASGILSNVTGSAYLFNVTTGEQLFKLNASDAALGDQFGISVALSGNTALVGASFEGGGNGSAYLFDVGTGQEIMKLTASDSGYLFGHSVALSGNRALIGKYGDDDKGSFSGSAYLFDVATGEELFKFTASDGAANDSFGISVALGGNMALVGAWLDDDDGDASGSAYLFDVVPEPSSLLLGALAGAKVFAWRKRLRRPKPSSRRLIAG